MATRAVASRVGPPAARAFANGPLVLAAILFLLGLLVSSENSLLQGAVALSFAIAATGLGLALGLAGEYLLGQMFMFATSAYVAAVLVAHHDWSFWPAALAGTAAAALVSLAMSVIGLRISRFYFALVGFFLVYLIPNIVEIFSSETGGSVGVSISTVPELFGVSFENRQFFWFTALFLVLSLLLVRNVRAAPLGVYMRRLRENPATVVTSGVPTWRIRVSTYVLSGLLAGIGGAIYSQLFGYLLPNDFSLTYTILLFAAVLVGGQTTLLGPSIGVVLLYVVPRVVIDVEGYSELIYGGIVLLSVLAFRGGVEEAVVGLYRRWRAARRPASKAPTAGAPGSTAAATGGIGDVAEVTELLLRLREDVPPPQPLTIRAARKHYGGVAALDFRDDDEVTVEPGRVHLLLGPNGSGKTTLLNAACGLARLDSGRITLGGRDVTSWTAARVARAGVSRSFQAPSLPPEVTPRDLLSARLSQLRRISYVHWLLSDPIAWRARRESDAAAEELARAAGLGDAINEPCTGLTSGQLRIVDVMLAVAAPSSLVMLDEPAAGLSEAERRHLAGLIRSLAAKGLGILMVEHDLELALGIADEVTVLAQGRVLAKGTADDVKDDHAVREVLIGEPA